MGDYMTGKEIVNLIRKLREKGIDSDEILKIIEYVETHDPREDGDKWQYFLQMNNDSNQ